MEKEDILTNEEKRYLWLSAAGNLNLQEQIEYSGLKKEQNYKMIQNAEKHALTAGTLSALMLTTAFMSPEILPAAVCVGHFGYLFYLEQTYFKKVSAKCDYYFNTLRVNAENEKHAKALEQKKDVALNRSLDLSDRVNAADQYGKYIEKIDLDRKNAETYYLENEYKSLPRFRIEILTFSVVSLLAGTFLPQMAFLSVAVGIAAFSSVLAKIDANTTRKKRYLHWAKKEENLKRQLAEKTKALEKQNIKKTDANVKIVSSHETLQKRFDNSHQKED